MLEVEDSRGFRLMAAISRAQTKAQNQHCPIGFRIGQICRFFAGSRELPLAKRFDAKRASPLSLARAAVGRPDAWR